MRNGKDVLSEPVVVRLTLVSLTPSGIVQAEALIRSTDGLAVLEVEVGATCRKRADYRRLRQAQCQLWEQTADGR